MNTPKIKAKRLFTTTQPCAARPAGQTAGRLAATGRHVLAPLLALAATLLAGNTAWADNDWNNFTSGTLYWDDSSNWSATSASANWAIGENQTSDITVTFTNNQTIASGYNLQIKGGDYSTTFAATDSAYGLAVGNLININTTYGNNGHLIIDSGTYSSGDKTILGNSAHTGELTMKGGSLVSHGDIYLANAASAVGTLNVDGGDISSYYWLLAGVYAGTANINVNSGSLKIGTYDGNGKMRLGCASGSTATLTQTGGTVYAPGANNNGDNTIALNIADTADSTATVNMLGGEMYFGKSISIGHAGEGTLNIGGGTLVVTNSAYAGNTSGAKAHILVTNGTFNVLTDFALGQVAGSTADMIVSNGTVSAKNLYVGSYGIGSLDIEGGMFTNTAAIYVGNSAGVTGTVTVAGTGILGLTAGDYGFRVGQYGVGEMTLKDSASVSAGWFSVADLAGSTGTVTIADSASLMTSNPIYVGTRSKGTMNIQGGTVKCGSNMFVGAFNPSSTTVGDGILNMSGGSLNVSGQFEICAGGSTTGKVYVANAAITNTSWLVIGCYQQTAYDAYLEIDEGGEVNNNSSSDHTTIGSSVGDGSSSTIYVNGGTLISKNNIYIAENSTGSSGGTSTLTIDSGLVDNSTGTTYFSKNSSNSGTVMALNLNGGTYKTKQITYGSGSGTATVNLNGGTLVAADSAASAFISTNSNPNMTVVLGSGTTTTIDTQGQLLTIAAPISGSGTLKKSGEGTLTISGAYTATGDMNVDEGVLTIPQGSALGALKIAEDSALVVAITNDTLEANTAITLFTATSLDLGGGDLADAIALSGPACLYTLSQEEDDGTITVKATPTTVYSDETMSVRVWNADSTSETAILATADNYLDSTAPGTYDTIIVPGDAICRLSANLAFNRFLVRGGTVMVGVYGGDYQFNCYYIGGNSTIKFSHIGFCQATEFSSNIVADVDYTYYNGSNYDTWFNNTSGIKAYCDFIVTNGYLKTHDGKSTFYGNMYLDSLGEKDSRVYITGDYTVGNLASSSNELVVADGSMYVTGQILVGEGSSSTGIVHVTGGAVTNTSWMVIGSNNSTGYHALFQLDDGEVYNNGGSGTHTTIASWGGNNSTAELRVNGGKYLLNHDIYIGERNGGSRGDATLTQNGGVIDNNLGWTYLSKTDSYADSVLSLNLNGGTFLTRSVRYGSGSASATITFNGGTLQAADGLDSSFIPANDQLTVNVASGGAIFDDGGHSVTIAEPLLTDATSTGGGLVKKGAGTLTLATDNTYTGATAVDEGVLNLPDGAFASNTTSGELILGGGSVSGTAQTWGKVTITNGTYYFSALPSSSNGYYVSDAGVLILTKSEAEDSARSAITVSGSGKIILDTTEIENPTKGSTSFTVYNVTNSETTRTGDDIFAYMGTYTDSGDWSEANESSGTTWTISLGDDPGAYNKWTGSSTGDWMNNNNWMYGIPTTNQEVHVESDVTIYADDYYSVSGIHGVSNLVIDAGYTLTLGASDDAYTPGFALTEIGGAGTLVIDNAAGLFAVENRNSTITNAVTLAGSAYVSGNGTGTVTFDTGSTLTLSTDAAASIKSGVTTFKGTVSIPSATLTQSANETILLGDSGTTDTAFNISGTGKYVGNSSNGTRIGYKGTASMTISDSGAYSSKWMTIGNDSGTGTVTMKDSATLTLSEKLWLGDTGTGSVVLEGGTLSAENDIVLGNSAAGTLSISNATVKCGPSRTQRWFIFSNSSTSGTGTLNLQKDGVLSIWHVEEIYAGSSAINFNGGTLQLIGQGTGNCVNLLGNSDSTHTTNPTVTVNSQGGTIDTQGYNTNVTIPIGGEGTLTKTGSGTLTFTGPSLCAFNVSEGVVDFVSNIVTVASLELTGVLTNGTNVVVSGAAKFNSGAHIDVADASADALVLTCGSVTDLDNLTVTCNGEELGSEYSVVFADGKITISRNASIAISGDESAATVVVSNDFLVASGLSGLETTAIQTALLDNSGEGLMKYLLGYDSTNDVVQVTTPTASSTGWTLAFGPTPREFDGVTLNYYIKSSDDVAFSTYTDSTKQTSSSVTLSLDTAASYKYHKLCAEVATSEE